MLGTATRGSCTIGVTTVAASEFWQVRKVHPPRGRRKSEIRCSLEQLPLKKVSLDAGQYREITAGEL